MNKKIVKKIKGTRSPDSRLVKIRTEGRGWGILKTGVAALFILVQLGIFILLYLGFAYSIGWYLILSAVLSGLCVISVISSYKTGTTKVVWVLFLTVCFSFGYIGYLMSSEYVFFGLAKRRYGCIFARSEKFIGDNVIDEKLPLSVKHDANFLWNTGKFKLYNDTLLNYFPSGVSMFDDVIAEISAAKSFVFIEFFIISDGKLLNRIFEILSEKVAQGVDVRIIADGIGSHGTLSFGMRRKIKKAGIKLKFFNRIQARFTFALNLRDHRKIIVVDGKCGYVGGCNLADEYINAKRMYGYWKDVGLKLSGKAVDALTLQFLRQWEFVTRRSCKYEAYFNRYDKVSSDAAVIPYVDGKDYVSAIGKGVYDTIISGAREKLYIMTPYLVPDEQTFSAIAEKALAGVDVRIVIPDVPDKGYVYLVTLDYAERLAETGVKVYKMRNAFVHAKLMLNENCASVSSVNIDLRSYYNQFENGVYTNDVNVLKDIESDFSFVFGASDTVENDAVNKHHLRRFIASILKLFAPLM